MFHLSPVALLLIFISAVNATGVTDFNSGYEIDDVDALMESTSPQQIEQEILEGLHFYRQLVELSMSGDSGGIRKLCQNGDLIRCSNGAFDFWKIAKEIDKTKNVHLGKGATVYDYLQNGGVLPGNVQESLKAKRKLATWQQIKGATPEKVEEDVTKLFNVIDEAFRQLERSGVPIQLVKVDFEDATNEPKDDEMGHMNSDDEIFEFEDIQAGRLRKRDGAPGELVTLKKRDSVFGALKAVAASLVRFFRGIVGTVVLFVAFALFIASVLTKVVLGTAGMLLQIVFRGSAALVGWVCATLDCLLKTVTCCLAPELFSPLYKEIIRRPVKETAKCGSACVSGPIPAAMFLATDYVASLGFWLVGAGRHSLISQYDRARNRFVRKRPSAVDNANVIRDNQ